MRLGAKILLTAFLTFSGFITALFFVSQGFLLGSFEDIEDRRTVLNVERVVSALEGEIANLHSFNLDWASWDDSYSFVIDRNDDYIKSTLNDETLAKQRLNLIVFLNSSASIVFSKTLDHYTMKELPFPEGLRSSIAPAGLLPVKEPETGKSGIISLDNRFMIISARPITTSEGKGPVRGTLIMGRYLDGSEIRQLSDKTHVPVNLTKYDRPFFERLAAEAKRPLAGGDTILTLPTSGDLIEGYAVVKDLYGSPSLLLRVEFPRDIYKQGKKTLSYFMIYLFAAALISTAAMLVFLKRNILSRVSLLSRAASEIGRTGNLAGRVREGGRDEISVLSREINRMLSSLEELETERRNAEQEIHAAKDELEKRVRERTTELLEKNIELNEEIAERKRVEEAMKEMVYHDYLTGLPNRMLFTDRLNQVIAGRRASRDTIAAVMFMDMDRFKVVNDSLGHAAGDELIKKIANMALGALREGDTVARIGGDEFMILLRDVAKFEDIPAVVERIFKLFRKPIALMGNDIFMTVSVGIAVYPYDGTDSTSLMMNADIAMYHAKNKGGNTSEMYNPEMAQRTVERLTIGNKLRSALEQDEFILYYQAQYDLKKKRFTGAEALIRWQDREMGLVSPVTFIPIAEETGVIVPIGEWVLRTACSLNKKLNQLGLEDLSISINISPRMFGEPGFTGSVVNILKESGLDPRYLMLEITEGLLMSNLVDAARTIKEMKSAGVRFSVDDFGTGYSSLAYLKNLSINELKIDRSFIKDLTKNTDDKLIIKAIISLAHSLSLEVIAEGVETREQLDFLVEHHCDKIQGYYYSKPLPEKEFFELITATNGKAQS
jgi:diguanylate cyclase (GGDEF)-like protein